MAMLSYLLLLQTLASVLILVSSLACPRSQNQQGECTCDKHGATEVTTVDCSDRGFSSVPPGIPKSVVHLDLSLNNFTLVPKEKLASLKKLKILNLSANKIVRLKEDAFTSLTELETINLSQNRIRRIDWKAFRGLINIKNIELPGNQLICDCAIKGFRQWIENPLIAVSGAECSNLPNKPNLPDLSVSDQVFTKCEEEQKPATCQICEKRNAKDDADCNNVGNETKCDANFGFCKSAFQFISNGDWILRKRCAQSACLSASQPEVCMSLTGPLDGQGICRTCCTNRTVCNRESDILSYLEKGQIEVRMAIINEPVNEGDVSTIRQKLDALIGSNKLPGVNVLVDLKIDATGIVTLFINSTYLRGRFDDVQEQINKEFKLKINQDALLKKYLNSTSITMWEKGKCEEDTTIDALKGNYTWPATKENAKARVPCVKGKERFATRKCLLDLQKGRSDWVEFPDLSFCDYLSETTKKLDELQQMTITNDSVNVVSTALESVSSSASNKADVSKAADVLNNIVTSKAAYTRESQNNTVKNVIGTVGNLLDVDLSTVRESGQAKSLVNSIETLLDRVNLAPGEELAIVDKNIAVSMIDTTTGKADDGLQFAVAPDPGYPDFNNTNVRLRSKRNPMTSRNNIEVPGGVFKARPSIKKAAFVVYKSTFFKAMEAESSENKTSNSSGKNANKTANSVVILAELFQNINGLTGDNKIGMSFEQIESNDKQECGWWNETLNQGNGGWSTQGCHVEATNDGVTTCKCDHLTNFALLMDVFGSNIELNADHQLALTIISITGCTLSALGLISTIFSYIFFRKKLLKDNPSKILLNLCLALLGLNLVFLGGTHYQVDDGYCKAVAILLHYFLMAGFTWMAVEAFYMYLALVKVFQPYFSKLILKCCLVGWGLPLVIVAITIGVNETDNYFLKGGSICWIRMVPFYGAVVAPIIFILLMNIVAFIMVVRQLRRLTERKKLTKTHSAHTSTTTQLRGALSVLVLLGLTWLFAFFSIGEASLAFAYIFAILNTLQGLWIFIFYCILKNDVKHAWMRKLSCCPTPEDSKSSRDTLRTLPGTLSQYTSDRLSKLQPLSPCDPYPSNEYYALFYKADPSENGPSQSTCSNGATSTTSTRIYAAASTKSKSSQYSNSTTMSNLSDSTTCDDDKPTGDKSNAYENAGFSNPTEDERTSEQTEQEKKKPKWEVKEQSGFVDSRGFSRPV